MMKSLVLAIVLNVIHLLQVKAFNSDESDRIIMATCPKGGILDTTGKYCCPGSCGQCGGKGCNNRNGGARACCTSQITKSCGSSSLPCVISGGSSNMCPTGGILDALGKTCCAASCGKCGGNGCQLRPGGAAACCISQVTTFCKGNKLPCKITESGTQPPKANDCPAGGVLDASGKVCCPGSCGKCGGKGCEKLSGGSANCCTSKILVSCATGKLPCVLGKSGPTPTPIPMPIPMPTPVPTPTPSGLCANGIIGILAYDEVTIEVCCPKSCPVCNPSDACTAAPECCAYKIAEEIVISDVNVSCRNHQPPCVMPPADDLCTPINPCKHGARCGYAWQSGSMGYNPRTKCECEEVSSNLSGQYCEIECGPGETPCGYSVVGYRSNEDSPNDICCSKEEDCLMIDRKYGYQMACFSKVRPSNCDTNPCKNGAMCVTAIGDAGQYRTSVCYCPGSFEGTYCEIAIGT